MSDPEEFAGAPPPLGGHPNSGGHGATPAPRTTQLTRYGLVVILMTAAG